MDYGRDVDLGKPPNIQDVKVVSDTDVVNALAEVVSTLINVVEQLKETQTALSLILGQEIEAEEP